MELRELTLRTADGISKSAFDAMTDDYRRAGELFLGMTYDIDYSRFCQICLCHAEGIGLPRGAAAYTRYFLCDDNGNIYAQGDVRHQPTPEQTEFSGYLGYGVLPSKRGAGVGTYMCKLLLEKASQWYDEVIITCNTENDASRRVIEKNGGVLLDIRYWKKNGRYMRRYSAKTIPNNLI